MKKNISIIQLSLATTFLVFSMYGCSRSAKPTVVTSHRSGVATANGTIEYISCKQSTGKKLIVSPIKCKSTGCREQAQLNGQAKAFLSLLGRDTLDDFSGIGDGLSNMLQTSLDKTGCFDILDREAMQSLKEELAFAGKSMKIESADILVGGAVTSVNLSKTKSSFLGFSKKRKTAKLGMDMKIIDVGSSKVVLSQNYSAESGKTNYGYISNGFRKTSSGMGDASMEEVARDIINRLTYDIVKHLAPNSYKIETKTIE